MIVDLLPHVFILYTTVANLLPAGHFLKPIVKITLLGDFLVLILLNFASGQDIWQQPVIYPTPCPTFGLSGLLWLKYFFFYYKSS